MSKNSEGDSMIASDFVHGHRNCQTSEAKWLCINSIYEKMHRPNFYDIGGTSIKDEADYWFTFKTERSVNIFLIHIFVCNRHGGSFNICLSASNIYDIDEKKQNIVKLSNVTKYHEIKKAGDGHITYLTTYNFSDLDADFFRNKMLLIPVNITPGSDNASDRQSFAEEIKASHDLGSLLDHPFEADYTIESSDGVQFKVHKNVLATHSKVFKAMFREDDAHVLSESNHMLQDVEKGDLYSFLQFLYTGTVKDVDNCNALVLLQLSDKYDVHGLKELAEAILMQKLDMDNALSILVWADLFNSTSLKISTMKFIKKNKEIFETEEFCKISNIKLVHELMKYLVL